MFMGLALMPEYFNPKINLYVALEPPVFLGHLDESTQKLASHWKLIELAMETVEFYDFVDVLNSAEISAIEAVCGVLGDLC
jgi:hypothetical protein